MRMKPRSVRESYRPREYFSLLKGKAKSTQTYGILPEMTNFSQWLTTMKLRTVLSTGWEKKVPSALKIWQKNPSCYKYKQVYFAEKDKRKSWLLGPFIRREDNGRSSDYGIEEKEWFRAAKIAEESAVGALEMCDVEWQHGAVWSIALLTLWSILRDVLDKVVFTGKMQKFAMGVFMHFMMIKSVDDTILKRELIGAVIHTIESNFVR